MATAVLTRLGLVIQRRGSPIIIARSGKPVAKLSQLRSSTRTIVLGVLKDRVEVSDDFDAPLPEDVLGAFEGDW